MHDLLEYISEHILVFLVILIAVFSLAYVQDVLARVVVLTLMIGFYVMYGVLHHQQEKTFRVSVLLEYLLVAAIVALVVYVSIR